jgi:hypothetical protein
MNHLGGHLNITHVDEGILRYFRENHESNSLLDVGCGPAGQIELAKKIGFSSFLGVDGDPKMKKDFVKIQDFSIGEFDPETEFDLGWSCEFVEHVEEEYIPNFMKCFTYCKFVAITHALPNTPGHHHVNCQKPDYWKEVFNDYGLNFNKSLTNDCREKSTMKRDFFRKNGMVFVNKNI